MKISPPVDLAFKIVIFLLGLLGAGTWFVPSFVSVAVAHDITGVSSTAVVVVTGIYTILGTGTTPSVTLAGRVSALFIAGFVVFTLFQPSAAQAATRHAPLPPRRPVAASTLPNINDLLNKIASANLVDMQAALDDAKGTGDDLSVRCYPSVIGMVQALQASLNTPNLPKVHPVLLFQHARDVANALRPGSPVNIACAPMAEQVKTDLTTFIAAIVGGTVTFASFGL